MHRIISLMSFNIWLNIILGQDEKDWTSCTERCGEMFSPGRPCYCNDVCAQYENCCDDYYRLCSE